ncbi:unnamed protein product [Discula destructiva]
MAGMFPSASSAMDPATDPTYNLTAAPADANGPTPDPKVRYGKSLPPSWEPLYQKPMGTPMRKLRIVTIGAAVSGLGFAYQLQHAHKLTEVVEGDGGDALAEHVIYEANEDIGGTWLVNTYPGVACDVPAHLYTFPFEPNPDWSTYYATGPEIHTYIKRTAEKYSLARDVKLHHRVEHAAFAEASGRWHLRVRNTQTNAILDDTCDILVQATGFLSHWRWPSIPGLRDFAGHLAHSADWAAHGDFDYAGKRIGILGNGSSAIQILPQLAPGAARLTNFIRNPTYITPGLGSTVIGGAENYAYSPAEQRRFRVYPDDLRAYRKRIQHETNVGFAAFTKDSGPQRAACEATARLMRERLGWDEELARRLVPEWEVGCRRATPGPGYLEAFTRENVELVTEGIECVTERGVRTADGREWELDALVCATGFDVSHCPPWPVVGRGGVNLADQWAEEPYSYLSLMAAGFPNFFMFGGPNNPVGHGSLMSQLQWSANWMCRWARKIAEENIIFIDPKPEVVEEFNAYADEIMQTLVWSGGCRSWYKKNRVDGRVTAVWAGSAISYHDMIKELRPEDFEIKYRSRNRFRFMGNGKTRKEYVPGEDLAFYIYK